MNRERYNDLLKNKEKLEYLINEKSLNELEIMDFNFLIKFLNKDNIIETEKVYKKLGFRVGQSKIDNMLNREPFNFLKRFKKEGNYFDIIEEDNIVRRYKNSFYELTSLGKSFVDQIKLLVKENPNFIKEQEENIREIRKELKKEEDKNEEKIVKISFFGILFSILSILVGSLLPVGIYGAPSTLAFVFYIGGAFGILIFLFILIAMFSGDNKNV